MEGLYDPSKWEIVEASSSKNIVKLNPPQISLFNTTGSYWSSEQYGEWDMTLFGIPIIRLRQDIGYYFYWNVRIDSIFKYDAYVKHNYSPMSKIALEYSTSWISGSEAKGEFRMSYSVGPIQDLSVQMGNIYGTLRANTTGSGYYSFWTS